MVLRPRGMMIVGRRVDGARWHGVTVEPWATVGDRRLVRQRERPTGFEHNLVCGLRVADQLAARLLDLPPAALATRQPRRRPKA